MRSFWYDLLKVVIFFVVGFLTLIYLFGTPRAPQQKDKFNLNSLSPQYKTLTLKQIFHHGSLGFPKLFRRLDVDLQMLATLQDTSGIPFTHTIRAVPGNTAKPDDIKKIKEYRRRSKEDAMSIKLNYADHNIMVPDVTDDKTLIRLAMMTYNAYIPIGANDWYDLGDYDWHHGFGWQDDGIRGHVFADAENKTVIISIKGTTMITGDTVARDKINDNRLFSCCCSRVDPTWKTICNCYKGGSICDQTCLEDSVDEQDLYYNIGSIMFEHIVDNYPNATIWLTGHSLGGGLAGLLGWTYGAPTVTYEAPGEQLAARRLHLPAPPALSYHSMPIWHVGHSADPIFMGSCTGLTSSCWLGGYAMESKCHHGRVCLYDTVKELGWNVHISTHRVKEVIEKVLSAWKEVPKCEPEDEECVDCGLWEFKDYKKGV